VSVTTRDIKLNEAAELLVMRYHDGELSPGELREVAQRLDTDPLFAEALESLGQSRSALRDAYAQEVSTLDFGALWSGIEAGMDALESEPGRLKAPVRAASAPSLWQRVIAWLGDLGWQPLATGAMAMAVVLSIGISHYLVKPDGEDVAFVDPSAGADPFDGLAEEGVVIVEQDTIITEGVEVSSLEGGESATVMVLTSPDQATIIWVSEDDGGTSI